MRRSDVNDIIRAADDFIRSFGVALPPFALWSPAEMRARRAEIGGILTGRLGWDLTDYGSGQFGKTGQVGFALRNTQDYAERVMIARHDQHTPLHIHATLARDLVNRGGATLAVKLHAADAKGGPCGVTDVAVALDGRMRWQPAGSVLHLAPGESVTLAAGLWRAFWGEGGDVLLGEVAAGGDAAADRRFAEPTGSLVLAAEDEAPLHLLVTDYPVWLG